MNTTRVVVHVDVYPFNLEYTLEKYDVFDLLFPPTTILFFFNFSPLFFFLFFFFFFFFWTTQSVLTEPISTPLWSFRPGKLAWVSILALGFFFSIVFKNPWTRSTNTLRGRLILRYFPRWCHLYLFTSMFFCCYLVFFHSPGELARDWECGLLEHFPFPRTDTDQIEIVKKFLRTLLFGSLLPPHHF